MKIVRTAEITFCQNIYFIFCEYNNFSILSNRSEGLAEVDAVSNNWALTELVHRPQFSLIRKDDILEYSCS
jgi:hypothetical protein